MKMNLLGRKFNIPCTIQLVVANTTFQIYKYHAVEKKNYIVFLQAETMHGRLKCSMDTEHKALRYIVT